MKISGFLGKVQLEKVVWCLSLLNCVNVIFCDAYIYYDIEEARLVNRLLDGYNKAVRPVRKYEDTVHLQMSITVAQLVNMDEVNLIMTSSVWFNNKWTDEFLTWNPEDFENLTTTMIDSSLIWLPDIMLYNDANDDFANSILKTKATISYDGTVQWNAPANLKSACKLNPLFFPFDEQNCTLMFGSWTYNGNQLNISCPYEEGDTTSFQTSGEWTLEGLPTERFVTYYPCCNEPYPDLRFYVILKRQPLFFLLNLILPCIIVSALVLLGFYLPSDAGEKVTLTITILLSLTVFLLLVAETMPPTSEVVPLIGQYFVLNIILVGICAATTVIILGIHHHGHNQRVPKWLHTLVLVKLASALCIRNGISKSSEESDPYANVRFPEGHQLHADVDGVGIVNPVFQHDNGRVYATETDGNTSSPECCTTQTNPQYPPDPLEKYVISMAKNVFCIGRMAREKTDSVQQATEWMEVARVLDRFFMIVFGIAQFLITVITLSLAAANKSI